MMKKWIAMACAGTLMLALTACSPADTSTTTVSSKPAASASAAASSEEASAEASEEASAETTAAGSDDALAETAEDTSAVLENTAAEAEGDIKAGADSAASAAADAASSAAGDLQEAAGALVDSAQAAQISSLLSTGDFTQALSTVESLGNETLTQAMQALADAAQSCNVATEPNSGDIIVYGDNAEVVDGTTNVIPFVNMTHDYAHLQIGFVERAEDSSSWQNASPSEVSLTAGGENWTWDTNASNTVTVPGSSSTTWVFETALSDTELPLLTSVGNAQSGQASVTFTDAEAGTRDYQLSDAEIGAFSNLGQFATALQQLKSCLGA